MPGAGFEPARSCEQRFLRPLAYAIRLPGRALILCARPGAERRIYFVAVLLLLLKTLYAARGVPLASTSPASKPLQPPLPVPNQL